MVRRRSFQQSVWCYRKPDIDAQRTVLSPYAGLPRAVRCLQVLAVCLSFEPPVTFALDLLGSFLALRLIGEGWACLCLSADRSVANYCENYVCDHSDRLAEL
jgi:hypothetical protein